MEGLSNFKPGDPVAMVEDVVTTGGSLLKACERVKDAGLNVVAVCTVLDRGEGGREAIEAGGIPAPRAVYPSRTGRACQRRLAGRIDACDEAPRRNPRGAFCLAGREKNKGVDKKVGGTQDNGLGFCEKEIFMPFECVSMRVWGCTALLLAGLMCVPEARAWEAMTDGLRSGGGGRGQVASAFFLMEKGKSRDYLCTTGQAQGDKQVRGDLKTPGGRLFCCAEADGAAGF